MKPFQIDLPQKAEINGDLFELEILVLNLLRNAADAVEPLKDKALIKVSVASEDADWVLSIMDNGPPVPDEVLERMKKALQNSLKADGLGLGLKIVFAIAERHRVELKFSRVDPQGLRADQWLLSAQPFFGKPKSSSDRCGTKLPRAVQALKRLLFCTSQ